MSVQVIFILLVASAVSSDVLFSANNPPAPSVVPAGRIRLGGTVDLDPTNLNEYETNALTFAISYISEGSSSSYRLGLLKVVAGTSQVVSGWLYTFKVQVARTSCEKSAQGQDCPVEGDASDPDFNECDVAVWDQPWMKPRYKVTKLKCSLPNANANLG